MKNLSAILILFLLTSACVATKFSSTEDTQYLKCYLEASSGQWLKGSPAIVNVSIENTSTDSKKFMVSSFFEIYEITDFEVGKMMDFEIDKFLNFEKYKMMGYWGPVRLSAVSEHLPANTHYKLFLKPGQKRTFEVDLSKIKWEAEISSWWPHQDLFDLVSSGNYKLSFDIKIHSGDTSKRILSNSVDIIIKDFITSN